jgi:putative NIF3 family GTP cyclohydrolase 1 type 2
VRLDEVVRELDAYFRVPDVLNAATFAEVYPDYWQEFTEAAYEELRNGLMVRAGDEVERAATCVFPSDEIVASLEPRTLLFSEHPVAFQDDVQGFEPLARSSFERMLADEVSFYQVHEPLDHHPDVSPSRLVAEGLGLSGLDEYFPIADGIPGGAAIAGDSELGLDALAERVRDVLGPEVPVDVLSRPRAEAGRVAVVAGGGADARILEASLERNCTTYLTGNAATECRLRFVQEQVRAFRALADEEGVSVLDATHYGLEKPPQLAMAEWFRRLGLQADFRPGRPERAA